MSIIRRTVLLTAPIAASAVQTGYFGKTKDLAKCEGECTQRDNTTYFSCNVAGGGYGKCSPDNTHTVYGVECKEACATKGKVYGWCEKKINPLLSSSWDYCSPDYSLVEKIENAAMRILEPVLAKAGEKVKAQVLTKIGTFAMKGMPTSGSITRLMEELKQDFTDQQWPELKQELIEGLSKEAKFVADKNTDSLADLLGKKIDNPLLVQFLSTQVKHTLSNALENPEESIAAIQGVIQETRDRLSGLSDNEAEKAKEVIQELSTFKQAVENKQDLKNPGDNKDPAGQDKVSALGVQNEGQPQEEPQLPGKSGSLTVLAAMALVLFAL